MKASNPILSNASKSAKVDHVLVLILNLTLGWRIIFVVQEQLAN